MMYRMLMIVAALATLLVPASALSLKETPSFIKDVAEGGDHRFLAGMRDVLWLK